MIYLRATIVVTLGMIGGALLEWVPSEPSPWRWFPLGVAYLVGGAPIVRDTLRTLREGKLSVDFLMGTAAIGAAAVGQPLEGAILIFLFSLSNTLEAFALGRTRREIEALMDLHPENATLVDDEGREIGKVAAAELKPGQAILVRPGERIACDGKVRDGRSEVDQSAITGESVPVSRSQGDEVFAGTINESGVLTVEVTRLAGQTMLARIVRMVAEAREERVPAQEFIDRFAHPYTIFVLVGSAATALVAWGIFDMTPGDAVYRAMSFLVVASPCALVISTPAAVLSAIANGARHGILFKGGGILDRAGTLDALAFDKTGTLTVGEPRLLSIESADLEDGKVLELAAAIEAASEHHLARAVLRAAREAGVKPARVEDFRAIPGEGVEGRIGDRWGWVGNDGMARRRSAAVPERLDRWRGAQSELGRSVVLLGEGNRTVAAMAFGDELRPGAKETIRVLKEECGIRWITILSGDHPPAVKAIAADLGADEVRAGLLPDQKVEALRELAKRSRGVAMVGDGVNDAPAMAAASVGIAMGAVGTDVAIETADVVLMSDELMKVPYLVRLGQRSRRVVRQNVWFSVGWMGFLVVTASTVGIPLPIAVVAHEGSTLLVVLNGLRLLRGRSGG
ncbi:MAG: cation-translocating P-type ATPase [Gemmatimonadota bacterium]